VSTQNAVHRIASAPDAPYRTRVDAIAAEAHGWAVNQAVGQVREILRNLLEDARAGLLTSIANRARAEILDDFLDTSEHYLGNGRKNEAGIVAGVVFEDTVRRAARKHEIDEKDVKLDALISGLASLGLITGVQAKRARAAADVRTRATHAQWDEFDASDVGVAIDITHEIVAKLLDA